MTTYLCPFYLPAPYSITTEYDPGPFGIPEIIPSLVPLKHYGNPLNVNWGKSKPLTLNLT